MRATREDDDWKERFTSLKQQHQRVLDESELLSKVLLRLSAIAEGVDQELDQQLPLLQESLKTYPPTAGFAELARSLDGSILQMMQRRDDNIHFSLESFSQILKRVESFESEPHIRARIAELSSGLDQAVEQYYTYPRLLNDLADIQRLVLDAQEQQSERSRHRQQSHDVSSGEDDSALGRVAEVGRLASSKTMAGSEDICAEVGRMLLKVLDQMIIPNEMLIKARRLRERIENGFQWDELESLFQEALQLAVKASVTEQEDFENYLRGLNGQLEDIQTFLQDSETDTLAAQVDVEQLDRSLREDVARVEDSLQLDNIDHLKQSVRTQLEGILQAVDRYKDEQSEREVRAEKRLQHLQTTIAEMEKQAADVQHHLEEQRLRATSDPLTGLPNRAAYDECIQQQLSDAVVGRTRLTLVVCDLDHFKEVNDNYGHLAGDKVLRLVAKILRGALRQSDFIGRYGGEEFVILLADTHAVQALELMDKLRRVVSQSPFNFKGDPVRVTMSFGIAQAQGDETPEELFSRADQSLYQAKENGRNCCVVAD